MKIELNNDANYVFVFEEIGYCLKCGKPLLSGKFCDDDCRRDYYAEINYDLGGF